MIIFDHLRPHSPSFHALYIYIPAPPPPPPTLPLNLHHKTWKLPPTLPLSYYIPENENQMISWHYFSEKGITVSYNIYLFIYFSCYSY